MLRILPICLNSLLKLSYFIILSFICSICIIIVLWFLCLIFRKLIRFSFVVSDGALHLPNFLLFYISSCNKHVIYIFFNYSFLFCELFPISGCQVNFSHRMMMLFRYFWLLKKQLQFSQPVSIIDVLPKIKVWIICRYPIIQYFILLLIF